MADNKSKKRPGDSSRINPNEDYEVSYWTKALGITKEKLKQVVSRVGNSANSVRNRIKH